MNDNLIEMNDKILALHGWRKIEKREHWERQCYVDNRGAFRSIDVPNYAKDIRAAWELVKEMYDAGFSVNITVSPTICPPFICDVHDSRLESSPPEEFKSFIEDGETIEIAICKLYIQWREVMQ